MPNAGSKWIALCLDTALPVSTVVFDEHGQPTRRYRKPILKVGKVNSGGHVFSIDADYLSGVAKTFQALKTEGASVPVQAGHNFDPAKQWGDVEDVFVEDGVLYASLRLVGADAIRAASVNDVSVYVVPAFDYAGKTFTDALLHVAMVPNPAAGGLGKFIPLAASLTLTTDNAPVYTAGDGANNMDLLKTIAAALDIDSEGMDEATLCAACTDKIKQMQAAAVEASAKPETKDEPKAPALAASADPAALEMLCEGYTAKIDALVSTGKINPAQAADLKKSLGETGKRPALMLSATFAKSAGLADSGINAVLRVLELATPLTLGGKTGSQAEPDDDAAKSAKTTQRLIAATEQYAGVTVRS